MSVSFFCRRVVSALAKIALKNALLGCQSAGGATSLGFVGIELLISAGETNANIRNGSGRITKGFVAVVGGEFQCGPDLSVLVPTA